jgi:molybdate transport system ATP-binding protein
MGLEVCLNKRINGFHLDVSWKIGNELAVLFGFSGAGKTLTLKMIAGLMRPDQGVVRLDGKTFFDSSCGIDMPSYRRSLGYVFQDLALFPHMTVMKNIFYGAKNISEPERTERAKEIMDAFRLDGLQRRLPSEISGGQKQRVAFARALIRQPDLLLLDEPFSALDHPLRIELRRFLMEIRSSFNIPIVLVTHDLDEASTLADTMIVYAHSGVAQIGTPKEVCRYPRSEDVASLVNNCRETVTSACG